MSIFIDRAGCNDPYLKGDLLNEWNDIRRELPNSWRMAMRRQPPHTKEGDIIHKDGTYFQVWRGGRACQLSKDTLGYPHVTSKVIGIPANYDRVTTWVSAILGPAHSAFPAPEGWAIALDPNEETRLDEWRVQDSYRTYQTQNTTRPS